MSSESYILIVVAVLMLAPAPLLWPFARRYPVIPAAIDGFAIVAVCGLVLLELLPQAMLSVGWPALLLAATGFSLPMLMERHGGQLGRQSHTWITFMGIFGLVLHSMVDGVALVLHESGADHHHDHGAEGLNSSVLAVLVHRLPVGLAVWGLMEPRFGRRAALAALGIDAIATTTGAFAGGLVRPMMHSTMFMVFQSFLSGALMHILLHTHSAAHRYDQRVRVAEVVGGLAGVALLIVVVQSHQATAARFSAWLHRLIDLSIESAPALVLGFGAAGLLTWGVPKVSQRWISRGSVTGQAAKGMLFGMPLPICSCGVVPLYQGLVRAGIPPAAGMAFLVATPELGLETVLLSIPLLGGQLTVVRLVAAAVVALGVGIIIGGRIPRLPFPGAQEDTTAPRIALGERVRQAMRYGYVELVDDTAVWIVFGLAVAALFDPGTLSSLMASWPPYLDVLVLAAIGLPIYVCASGATPIAAAMILAGVSPGAALAFLLAGPATNVTTFGVLSQLHGRKVAVQFAVSVFILAVSCGVATNMLLPSYVAPLAAEHGHDHESLLYVAAAGVLAVIFGLALLRGGLRGFLSPLVELGAHVHDDTCGHAHDGCGHPGCDHDHGPHTHPGCDHPGCGHDPLSHTFHQPGALLRPPVPIPGAPFRLGPVVVSGSQPSPLPGSVVLLTKPPATTRTRDDASSDPEKR
jgi:uncharacterized membrane protein YraQ (UPF0718 family)